MREKLTTGSQLTSDEMQQVPGMYVIPDPAVLLFRWCPDRWIQGWILTFASSSSCSCSRSMDSGVDFEKMKWYDHTSAVVHKNQKRSLSYAENPFGIRRAL